MSEGQTSTEPKAHQSISDKVKNLANRFKQVNRLDTSLIDNPSTINPQISRRTFLKRAAIGTGATAIGITLASGKIEKTLINITLDILKDPLKTSQTLESVAQKLGNEKDNPHFRQIHVIVNEGLLDYETKSGKKTFFKRNPAYKDWVFYQKKLIDARNSIGVVAQSPEEIAKYILTSLPDSVQQRYRQSATYLGNYELAFYNGSGMWNRLVKSDIDMSDNIAVATKSKEYVFEAKNYIENQVKNHNNKPVSASNLFSFFLQKNEGNIAESLEDTYIFLKRAARNNFETGDFVGHQNDQNKPCVDWMKANVLDEYGAEPYDKPTDIHNAINLVGKPYHTWNLLATIVWVPSQVVIIAGTREQLNYASSQGISKIETDLLTLADLQKTEELLLKH